MSYRYIHNESMASIVPAKFKTSNADLYRKQNGLRQDFIRDPYKFDACTKAYIYIYIIQ